MHREGKGGKERKREEQKRKIGKERERDEKRGKGMKRER